ncbi:VWA protein, partial [Dictyocaulus viviparus]
MFLATKAQKLLLLGIEQLKIFIVFECHAAVNNSRNHAQRQRTRPLSFKEIRHKGCSSMLCRFARIESNIIYQQPEQQWHHSSKKKVEKTFQLNSRKFACSTVIRINERQKAKKDNISEELTVNSWELHKLNSKMETAHHHFLDPDFNGMAMALHRFLICLQLGITVSTEDFGLEKFSQILISQFEEQSRAKLLDEPFEQLKSKLQVQLEDPRSALDSAKQKLEQLFSDRSKALQSDKAHPIRYVAEVSVFCTLSCPRDWMISHSWITRSKLVGIRIDPPQLRTQAIASNSRVLTTRAACENDSNDYGWKIKFLIKLARSAEGSARYYAVYNDAQFTMPRDKSFCSEFERMLNDSDVKTVSNSASRTSGVHVSIEAYRCDPKVIRDFSWTGAENIEKTMAENERTYETMRHQFIGTYSGVTRMYPRRYWRVEPAPITIDLFDPKFRPWFVNAESAPKDI